MSYFVFTSYPDKPVSGLPSNNPPTIGFSKSESTVKELCRVLYPDLVCASCHQTRKDAKRFVKKLICRQSQYSFKNFGEVL